MAWPSLLGWSEFIDVSIHFYTHYININKHKSCQIPKFDACSRPNYLHLVISGIPKFVGEYAHFYCCNFSSNPMFDGWSYLDCPTVCVCPTLPFLDGFMGQTAANHVFVFIRRSIVKSPFIILHPQCEWNFRKIRLISPIGFPFECDISMEFRHLTPNLTIKSLSQSSSVARSLHWAIIAHMPPRRVGVVWW